MVQKHFDCFSISLGGVSLTMQWYKYISRYPSFLRSPKRSRRMEGILKIRSSQPSHRFVDLVDFTTSTVLNFDGSQIFNASWQLQTPLFWYFFWQFFQYLTERILKKNFLEKFFPPVSLDLFARSNQTVRRIQLL